MLPLFSITVTFHLFFLALFIPTLSWFFCLDAIPELMRSRVLFFFLFFFV